MVEQTKYKNKTIIPNINQQTPIEQLHCVFEKYLYICELVLLKENLKLNIEK